jgi:hypothetical protein
MKKRQILWAIVFGSMLAITGCGDDENGGGGSGTGASGGDGTGATGGGGTGATGGGSNPSSTCEAFCGGSCLVESIDPGDDFDACVSACGPFFDDQCGSEAQAFVNCLESVDCDENAAQSQCQNQTIAWTQCLGGFSF